MTVQGDYQPTKSQTPLPWTYLETRHCPLCELSTLFLVRLFRHGEDNEATALGGQCLACEYHYVQGSLQDVAKGRHRPHSTNWYVQACTPRDADEQVAKHSLTAMGRLLTT